VINDKCDILPLSAAASRLVDGQGEAADLPGLVKGCSRYSCCAAPLDFPKHYRARADRVRVPSLGPRISRIGARACAERTWTGYMTTPSLPSVSLRAIISSFTSHGIIPWLRKLMTYDPLIVGLLLRSGRTDSLALGLCLGRLTQSEFGVEYPRCGRKPAGRCRMDAPHDCW